MAVSALRRSHDHVEIVGLKDAFGDGQKLCDTWSSRHEHDAVLAGALDDLVVLNDDAVDAAESALDGPHLGDDVVVVEVSLELVDLLRVRDGKSGDDDSRIAADPQVVVLGLHLALALGKELCVQGDLTLFLSLSGVDGLLVGELSGCVCRRLLSLLLGSHLSEFSLVGCSFGFDLGLELSSLPVFFRFLRSSKRLSALVPLLVACSGFFGLLEFGKCLHLFGFSGSNTHPQLSNVLLQRCLLGLGSSNFCLLCVQLGLFFSGLLGSCFPLFLGFGKSLLLLGLDQCSTGCVLSGSGFTLFFLKCNLRVTLGFELGAGILFKGLGSCFSISLLLGKTSPFGFFPLTLFAFGILFFLLQCFAFGGLCCLLSHPSCNAGFLTLLLFGERDFNGLGDSVLSALQLISFGGLSRRSLLPGIVSFSKCLLSLGFEPGRFLVGLFLSNESSLLVPC